MSLPFLTGGFLASLPRLRSNSVGSASTHSGHSADNDADGSASDSDHGRARPIPAAVAADGSAGLLGAGERRVGAYNSRDDVGCLCVMSGNWGGNRNKQVVNARINEDVKRGPASILLMQEAQGELIQVLTSPSVEGNPAHENQLFHRTAYQYDVVTGTENLQTRLTQKRWSICLANHFSSKSLFEQEKKVKPANGQKPRKRPFSRKILFFNFL